MRQPTDNPDPKETRSAGLLTQHQQGSDGWHEEELEAPPLDEATIGRAYRWSFIVMGVIAISAAVAFLMLRRPPPPGPTKLTTLSAPAAAVRPVLELPQVRFSDITAAAGLGFTHVNGARGEKLLPEAMGSGVAIFDFDGDQDQDLLFVNGTSWPWDSRPQPSATARLYRNEGGMAFVDVTSGSGFDVPLYGMGVAVGDYDGDGRVDVFLSAVGGNRLFQNRGGGKFSDVTSRAGVGGSNGWSTACAWLDYDRDGDLDLFVGNYVQWSREIDFEVGYTLVGIGRAYGPPMNFAGAFPYLYRNEGDGTFREVGEAAGLRIVNPATRVPAAKTLGVAPVDLDGDGWLDLVVANDTVQNFVFHNQRNGTFKEIGALSGIAFDTYGNARGAMGIDAAYYREDGALGIVIANFANEMNALYTARGNSLLFTDDAIAEGIGPASRRLLKFGIFFFDYDLDGRLDVLSVNGHLEQEITKLQESQQYAQPAQLFWNCGLQGGATFTELHAAHAGADLFRPIVGRGSAYGDLDNDGDLDVVWTQVGGPAGLLRNEGGSGNNWVRLKLIGQGGMVDAIGARVHAQVGGRELWREVMPTRSYLSQSELPITIGLGKSERVEEIEVLWPDGTRQRLNALPVNQLSVIRQDG